MALTLPLHLFAGRRAKQSARRENFQLIRARLGEVLRTVDLHIDGVDTYSFLKDVVYNYESLGPHGPLHIDRRRHCHHAITATFNSLPAANLPFQGNVTEATLSVLPVLEDVYEMPPTRPGVGSRPWILYMVEHPDEASFDELAQFPEVFKAFLKLEMRRGTRDGKPRPRPGEDMTFKEMYKLETKDQRKNMMSPRTGTAHNHMAFLRGVGHNFAINGCRNAGFWPTIVLAKNCPTGQRYDNTPRTLYRYWIDYCRAEGLTRSHQLARKVLMYLFYATPMYKGKPSPCVRIIHRCMMAGIHRFASGEAINCFAELLAMLNDKKEGAQCTAWLTDENAALASPKYLAAVETGMRNLALAGCKTFPRGSIATRDAWHKVSPWRKRQCYVFIARHYLGKANLKPYNNFRWSDHLLRERLIKTFDKRHLPLSDGTQTTHFAATFCASPACWDDESVPVRRELLPVTKATAEENNLEWDSDAEVWIEVRVYTCIISCVHMHWRVCTHALYRVYTCIIACVHMHYLVCTHALSCRAPKARRCRTGQARAAAGRQE